MKASFENLGAREIKRLASTIILINETRDITNCNFYYDLHNDEPLIFRFENENTYVFTASDLQITFNNNDNAVYELSI